MTASGTTAEADGHRPKRGERGRPLYRCREWAGKRFREHGRLRDQGGFYDGKCVGG